MVLGKVGPTGHITKGDGIYMGMKDSFSKVCEVSSSLSISPIAGMPIKVYLQWKSPWKTRPLERS